MVTKLNSWEELEEENTLMFLQSLLSGMFYQHPSFIHLLYPLVPKLRGQLEPIAGLIGRRQGDTLDESSVHCRSHRQHWLGKFRDTHARFWTVNFFFTAHQSSWHSAGETLDCVSIGRQCCISWFPGVTMLLLSNQSVFVVIYKYVRPYCGIKWW